MNDFILTIIVSIILAIIQFTLLFIFMKLTVKGEVEKILKEREKKDV